MTLSPLVSTEWLAEKLSSPDVVVVNAWLPPLGQPTSRRSTRSVIFPEPCSLT